MFTQYRRTLTALTLLLTLVAPLAEPARAAVPATCAAVPHYRAQLARFLQRDLGADTATLLIERGLPKIDRDLDPMTWTPRQLSDAAAGFDRFHATLIRMEQKHMVPTVARDYHLALVDAMLAVRDFYRDLADAGNFRANPKGDAIVVQATLRSVGAAAGRGNRQCGDTYWPDGDPDILNGVG